MNIYKDYIYNIRKIELETPYLIVIREYPPKYLYDYLKSILAIPFLEVSYNRYYGELRKIIFSYLNFYTVCTCHVYKESTDYENTLQYEVMMNLFITTLTVHEASHEVFLKEFQPIESPEEQEKFDEMLSRYETFKEELLAFGDELKELNKPEKIENFAITHFKLGANKICAMCDYSHVFIAKWLADHSVQIRISLDDIRQRIRRNCADFQKSYDDRLSELYNELYDLNKEKLFISRQECDMSQEAAANIKNISTLKRKIQTFGNYSTFDRLNEEAAYWSRRLADFEAIVEVITKIKTVLETTVQDEKIYLEYEVMEPPGSEKYRNWHRMAENLKNLKVELEEKYPLACRALITFFSARGIDRILYSDSIGSYYIDEYGHQNYIAHYGAKFYHMNCEGDFRENRDDEKYYFDENGRYVIQNGKKIYQIAPCTSYNNLTEAGVWQHVTRCPCNEPTCMSTDRYGTCPVRFHDIGDTELLPKTEIIDIEKTLDTETVNYLWKSFAWILPEILNELGTAKATNPIHYFAHLLLNKSHALTEKEKKARIKEAMKCREDIIKERKKNAEARTRAWRSKLIKPCKKSDCDPSYESTAYGIKQNALQFATDLAIYYTN